MKKISRAVLAAGLAVASASAFAADQVGNYFVNVGVGQAQYHVGRTDGLGYKLDDKDTAAAVRFGYQWHGTVDFGLEAGYVDLGKLVDNYDDGTVSFHDDLGAKGWLLGANLTHRFETPWYVQVRGGWLRSDVDISSRYSQPGYREYGSASASGNGWYAGVGGGYDFSNNVSVGVHYDNYHVKADQDGYGAHGNVSAFTVQLEYRF